MVCAGLREVPDRTYEGGSRIGERPGIDPLQFGIPPAMLESIDTTQLLALIVAREALRDAGIDPDGEIILCRTPF